MIVDTHVHVVARRRDALSAAAVGGRVAVVPRPPGRPSRSTSTPRRPRASTARCSCRRTARTGATTRTCSTRCSVAPDRFGGRRHRRSRRPRRTRGACASSPRCRGARACGCSGSAPTEPAWFDGDAGDALWDVAVELDLRIVATLLAPELPRARRRCWRATRTCRSCSTTAASPTCTTARRSAGWRRCSRWPTIRGLHLKVTSHVLEAAGARRGRVRRAARRAVRRRAARVGVRLPADPRPLVRGAGRRSGRTRAPGCRPRIRRGCWARTRSGSGRRSSDLRRERVGVDRDHPPVALADRRRSAEHARVLEGEEAVDPGPHRAVRVHLVGAGEPERLQHARRAPRRRGGWRRASSSSSPGIADGRCVPTRDGRRAKSQYASAIASSASRPDRPITDERSSSPSGATESRARSRSRPSSPSTWA